MSKLEFVFPLLAAYLDNKKISDEPFEEKYNNWKNQLKTTPEKFNIVEKISQNIYNEENRRMSNIESKGSWLLIGTSLSVLLVSVFGNYLSENNLSLFYCVTTGLIVYSIFNYFSTVIGVYLATKIRAHYVITLEHLRCFLDNKDNYCDLIAKRLASIECNCVLINRKTNLISVSQTHFHRGLLFMMLGLILLFYQFFI